MSIKRKIEEISTSKSQHLQDLEDSSKDFEWLLLNRESIENKYIELMKEPVASTIQFSKQCNDELIERKWFNKLFRSMLIPFWCMASFYGIDQQGWKSKCLPLKEESDGLDLYPRFDLMWNAVVLCVEEKDVLPAP